MEFETIQVSADGPVGHITLNRPDSLNALSRQTMDELRRAALALDDQTGVRVVILSGAGRAFTAGADLKDSMSAAETMGELTWTERREAGYLGSKMAAAIESMRALTIAQLHGYVIGGGVVLTTACDFRIAADDTVFSIPEVDLGIPLTWGGIPRLVRDIGALRTKELVISCRRFDAAEACSIGLINETVPAHTLDERVSEFADTLAAKPEVPALQTKAQVNAAAQAMMLTANTDGDLLVGTRADPASQQAAADYAARIFSDKKNEQGEA